MCCFFTALVFFGPRLGFLIYWLIAPLRVQSSLAGGHPGPGLHPLDNLVVCDLIPLERL
jgi:hypothetical protein